jgi:hypothetical protein
VKAGWVYRSGLLENERRGVAGVIAVFGQLGFWCDGRELICALLAPGALERRAFTIEVRR